MSLRLTPERLASALAPIHPSHPDAFVRIATWTEVLDRWSRVQRLVGWRSAEGLLAEGIADAWAAVPLVERVDRPIVDLGSGSGLPALILAAALPDRRFQLVEVRRKRAAFLKRAITAGDLTNARVICARSETLPDGAYQGEISRAYRPPPDYLADARRLLAPGGIAAPMLAQGEPPVAEGLTLFHVEHYAIGDRARRLAVYRRG